MDENLTPAVTIKPAANSSSTAAIGLGAPATILPAAGLPLPFSVVSIIDHWSRACARFWGQMAQVNDPVQVVNAEGLLGVEWIRDGVQAWIDFYATPMQLLNVALTAPLADRPASTRD
jgi:hypothetical protein